MGGGGRVGEVIFMSLLYYMFQSILNTFAFGYIFGGKKLIIFAEFSAKGGGTPHPWKYLIFSHQRYSQKQKYSECSETCNKLKT